MTVTNTRPTVQLESDLISLWEHLYGDQKGYIAVQHFRHEHGTKQKLPGTQQRFLAWPVTAGNAAQWLQEHSDQGDDAYFCPHLLTSKERTKKNARPVLALYADGDGATIPPDIPQPTAIVESSPGREYPFWRLSRPIDPEHAENLNERLSAYIGADPGGWDLSQLLRAPGTVNHTRPGLPPVRLIHLDNDRTVDPDELDALLPPATNSSRKRSTPDDLPVGDDEPPVRLSGYALKCWHGATGPGAGDRSNHLWGIAKDLYRAGATTRTVADALEERDRTLWPEPKYANRPEWYVTTARNAIQEVENESEEPKLIQANGHHDDDAEVQRLKAELDQSKDLQVWTMQCIQNKHIKGEKLTALAVVFDVANALNAQTREVDEHGWVRISRGLIAAKAGCSEGTVTNHLQRLSEWNILERKVGREEFVYDAQYCEYINLETGEVLDSYYMDPEESPEPGDAKYVSKLRVRLREKPVDTLKTLAFLEPDRESTWGGWRVSSKTFPEGTIIIRHRAECKGSNRHLASWVTEHKQSGDEPTSVRIPTNAQEIQVTEDAEITSDGEPPDDVPTPQPLKSKNGTSEPPVDSLGVNCRTSGGDDPEDLKSQDATSPSGRAKRQQLCSFARCRTPLANDRQRDAGLCVNHIQMTEELLE